MSNKRDIWEGHKRTLLNRMYNTDPDFAQELHDTILFVEDVVMELEESENHIEPGAIQASATFDASTQGETPPNAPDSTVGSVPAGNVPAGTSYQSEADTASSAPQSDGSASSVPGSVPVAPAPDSSVGSVASGTQDQASSDSASASQTSDQAPIQPSQVQTPPVNG